MENTRPIAATSRGDWLSRTPHHPMSLVVDTGVAVKWLIAKRDLDAAD